MHLNFREIDGEPRPYLRAYLVEFIWRKSLWVVGKVMAIYLRIIIHVFFKCNFKTPF
jgi:hypothetical protein